MPVMTREPLPDGVGSVRLAPVCPECQQQEVHDPRTGGLLFATRSTEPGLDGKYVVQPHQPWCRLLVDLPADPACPRCGGQVRRYEFHPAYSVAVPHPQFGTAHLVGPAEDVLNHPDRVHGDVRREASLDKLTVLPCEHELQGDDAHALMRRAAEIRGELARAAAQVTIDRSAGTLRAAETAGYGDVVAAYRHAVLRGAPDASGILAALHLLADRAPAPTGEGPAGAVSTAPAGPSNQS